MSILKRFNASSIRIAGYEFHGPYSLSEYNAPSISLIYAILVKDGKSFKIICVGHLNPSVKSVVFKLHEEYDEWVKEAGGEGNLFIAVYEMPGSSLEEREGVVHELVREYEPVCNQLVEE